MENYYSKFSLEQSEDQTINLNTNLYRKYGMYLTIILYVTIFLITSFRIDNYLIELLSKLGLFTIGFGLNVYGQFYFSKKLRVDGGEQVNPSQLLSIKKMFDPSFLFLTLFIIALFFQDVVNIPAIIINLVILALAIGHLYLRNKNEL